ncbi:MAG: diadenylate cyclase CdaA [Paludibacteraceae bacterium]|nr:diadenylate cyclase CdaA [Paludibacteraceae bacterium]
MPFAFGIKDIIDIFLVAILLYQVYRLMRNTGAINIFLGVMVFVFLWFLIVKVLGLGLTGAILNQIISVGAIALVVLFQNEIRKFLLKLGSRQNWKFYKSIAKVIRGNAHKDEKVAFPVMKLVLACRNMSRTKTGALIVIGRENSLGEYIESGEQIKADINTRLIENIFFKNSPLHDGAMIIVANKIVAAGAILPVSKNPNIPRHLGLRHRAAMGISEKTDALVIIVSEETGTISMAIDGAYRLNLTAEDLERNLTELLVSSY